MGVNPKIMVKPPNHPILIGFSIIFTIHFGGKILPFLVQHPTWFGGHEGTRSENSWRAPLPSIRTPGGIRDGFQDLPSFMGFPGGIGFYYRVYYIPLWKSPLNNQYFMFLI